MSIGETIRVLRKRSDLSQAELAQQVGVWQTQISQIESGATSPSLDLLQRIAQALGVKPGVIVDGFGADPEQDAQPEPA